MKRRNVLGSLTVMITLFAFVATAFCQAPAAPNVSSPGTAGCPTECEKCPIANVPCPETQQNVDDQGNVTIITDDSYPFDFEGHPYRDGGFGSYGYCTNFNRGADPYNADNPYKNDNERRDCKFRMDVCACDDACEINEGTKVGIQMVIETPGVYFAADENYPVGAEDSHTVYFDIDDSSQLLCDDNRMSLSDAYYMPDGGRVSRAIPGTTTTRLEVRNFGEVTYYRNYTPTINSKGMFDPDLSNPGTPLVGEHQGTLADINKVIALESAFETDYVFTRGDVQNVSNCWFWIDIPPLRVADAAAGSVIKLTVRLLFNREDPGVCDVCNPPDICECTITVGIVCCDEDVVDPGQGCMFFPYVLQGIQNDMGWTSGIAVTSRVDMPVDATCKLTLTDAAGNTAVYENNAVTPIWAFVLDNIMSQFTMTKGTAILPGASSLKVESNYSMDGYSFLNAQTFGAGTQPRGCGAGKCCP